MTVKVTPFTMTVPVLAVPGLAATEKENVPGPFPSVGFKEVIVSQEAVLIGDHVHPYGVVTATLPVPPAA